MVLLFTAHLAVLALSLQVFPRILLSLNISGSGERWEFVVTPLRWSQSSYLHLDLLK